MLGLAGCNELSEIMTGNQQSESSMMDSNSDGGGVQSLVLPATYIVGKEDGEVFALNGTSLEREFTGVADEDDGAVLEQALAEDNIGTGGRVFIRNADYYVDRRLTVTTSRTELVSDYARIIFQDHPLRGDREVQSDLLIGGSSSSTTRFVRVAGLILDGNKNERTGMTRVVEIAPFTAHISIESTAIFGGKGNEPGGGYGIGEADPANHVTIDNCVISDNDRHAYHPSGKHHTITNSTFINNATKGGDIFDLPSSRGLVANNLFKDNGQGVKIFRDMEGPDAGPRIPSNIVISGNVFVDNYSMGDPGAAQIQFRRANAESVTITGNEFRLPESPAGSDPAAHIDAQLGDPDDSGPNHIGTVRIRDNSFSGGRTRAINVVGEDEGSLIDKLIVEGNTFDEVGHQTISAERTVKLLVRNNIVDQSTSGEGKVVSGGSVDSGVITDNVLYNAVIPDDVRERDTYTVARNEEFPSVSRT